MAVIATRFAWNRGGRLVPPATSRGAAKADPASLATGAGHAVAFVPVAPKQGDRDGQGQGGQRGQDQTQLAALEARRANSPDALGRSSRMMGVKLAGLSPRPGVGRAVRPPVQAPTPDTVLQWQRGLGQAQVLVLELIKDRGGKEALAGALPSLLTSLGGLANRAGAPNEVSPASQLRYMSALADSMVGLAQTGSPRLNQAARRMQGLLTSLGQVLVSRANPAGGAHRPWESVTLGDWFTLYEFPALKRMLSGAEGDFDRPGFPSLDSRDLPLPFAASKAFSRLAAGRMTAQVSGGRLHYALMTAEARLYETQGRKFMVWAFRAVEVRNRSAYVSNMDTYGHLPGQFSRSQGLWTIQKADKVSYPPKVVFAIQALPA